MPKENQYYTPKGKCAADKNDVNPRSNASSDEYELEYKLFKRSLDEEHSRVVASANTAFGMNSWSHSISKLDIDCIDCVNGIYSVGAIAVVKVERKGGSHHEELGYGCCFGLKNKIVSVAISRQEAVLNALGRAVESFGENIFAESGSESEIKENVESSFKVQKLQDKPSEKTISLLANSSVMSQKTAVPSPPLNFTSEDVKLERKRKQQPMQEDYRRRLKMKEEQGQSTKYSKGNLQRENPTDEEEEAAFISTQELDEMINTAVHCKANAPLHAPLLSSPELSGNGGNRLWKNTNNTCPR